MAWEIDYRSGVQQDHRGRKYRIAVNSRGKQDKIYVQDDPSAEPARMIPVPEPKVPQPRRKIITTTVNGKKVPVVHVPRRLHVIEVRWKGNSHMSKRIAPNGLNIDIEQSLWNHLWISPDCGKTWQPIGGFTCDFHNQYHIDEEVK